MKDNENAASVKLVQPGKMTPQGSPSKQKGSRFEVRRKLYWRQRTANDVAFALALVGFILMVIDAELIIQDVYQKGETQSLVIKSFITVTTVLLICFVLLYHKFHMQLFMFQHSIQVSILWLFVLP